MSAESEKQFKCEITELIIIGTDWSEHIMYTQDKMLHWCLIRVTPFAIQPPSGSQNALVQNLDEVRSCSNIYGECVKNKTHPFNHSHAEHDMPCLSKQCRN